MFGDVSTKSNQSRASAILEGSRPLRMSKTLDGSSPSTDRPSSLTDGPSFLIDCPFSLTDGPSLSRETDLMDSAGPV